MDSNLETQSGTVPDGKSAEPVLQQPKPHPRCRFTRRFAFLAWWSGELDEDPRKQGGQPA